MLPAPHLAATTQVLMSSYSSRLSQTPSIQLYSLFAQLKVLGNTKPYSYILALYMPRLWQYPTTIRAIRWQSHGKFIMNSAQMSFLWLPCWPPEWANHRQVFARHEIHRYDIALKCWAGWPSDGASSLRGLLQLDWWYSACRPVVHGKG